MARAKVHGDDPLHQRDTPWCARTVQVRRLLGVELRVVGVGRRRLLIASFSPLRAQYSRSFGAHLVGLQQAMYLARVLGVPLYILWYRGAPNQVVHRLVSAAGGIVAGSFARDLVVRALWVASGTVVALTRRLEPTLTRTAGRPQSGNHPRIASRVRRLGPVLTTRLAGSAAQILRGTAPYKPPSGYELRREMVRCRIPLVLPAPLEARARTEAAYHALDSGSRIAVLHMRETGWRGTEGDSRNVELASFQPAVEELVRRGFRVVRIGAPPMTPVSWPGVVDLATDQRRTDLLELWCMLRAGVYVGVSSGPLELARLIGMPTFVTNLKSYPQGYPLRRSDLIVLMRLVSPDGRCLLSVREHLATKRGERGERGDLERPAHSSWVGNTSAEILDALVEFLDGLDHLPPETAAQAEFARLASMKSGGRFRYLGEGRIGRAFIERHLDRGEELPLVIPDRHP